MLGWGSKAPFLNRPTTPILIKKPSCEISKFQIFLKKAMRQAVGVLILFLLEESSGARVSLDQNEAAWRAEHAAKVDHFEWLDLPELVVSPPHYPIPIRSVRVCHWPCGMRNLDP